MATDTTPKKPKARAKPRPQPAPINIDDLLPKRTGDIWRDYDPQRVLKALDKSFGVLKDLDRETFLKEMHAARGQSSTRKSR